MIVTLRSVTIMLRSVTIMLRSVTIMLRSVTIMLRSFSQKKFTLLKVGAENFLPLQNHKQIHQKPQLLNSKIKKQYP